VRYLGMHVDPPGGLVDLGGMTLRDLGLVTGGGSRSSTFQHNLMLFVTVTQQSPSLSRK